MSQPSHAQPYDNPEEPELLNLDHLPAVDVATLLTVELPGLRPTFGVMPDPRDRAQIEVFELWNRLNRVLKDPVQVHRWRGDKRVIHVLQQRVLVVWASGQVTPLEWHATSCGVIRLRPVPPEQLDLSNLANIDKLGIGVDWYTRLQDATRWEFVQDHVWSGGRQTSPVPRQRCAKAFGMLREWLMHYAKSSRLEARIRNAMGLNPQVLEFTESLRTLVHPGATRTAVSTYNWVAQNLSTLMSVQREAPELTEWWTACAQFWTMPGDTEPLQWLKGLFREGGIGRRGWLLALKSGRTVLQGALAPDGALLRTPVVAKAFSHLYAHDQTGSGELIPAQMFELLCEHLRQPGWGWTDPGGVLAYLVDIWRREAPRTPQALADWTTVLHWLDEAGIPARLNARQRELGLSGLVRRAERWKREQERRALAEQFALEGPLPVWHEPIEHQGLRL